MNDPTPTPSNMEMAKACIDAIRNRSSPSAKETVLLNALAAKEAEVRAECAAETSMSEDCLAMIFETLQALEPDGEDLSAVPPMNYNGSIGVIVSKWRKRERAETLAPFIAAGLADAEGKPVAKGVLGTLAITEDGFLMGMGAPIWVINGGTSRSVYSGRYQQEPQWKRGGGRAFASYAAALAAREGKA